MSNLHRALRELLPEAPLLVASVVAINADNTVTVTFPGGTRQRVRGRDATVGGNVFVRSGVIEGAAPALTALTIEV